MVLGTYANLSATQEVVRENHLQDIRPEMKLKSPIIQSAVTGIPAKGTKEKYLFTLLNLWND